MSDVPKNLHKLLPHGIIVWAFLLTVAAITHSWILAVALIVIAIPTAWIESHIWLVRHGKLDKQHIPHRRLKRSRK